MNKLVDPSSGSVIGPASSAEDHMDTSVPSHSDSTVPDPSKDKLRSLMNSLQITSDWDSLKNPPPPPPHHCPRSRDFEAPNSTASVGSDTLLQGAPKTPVFHVCDRQCYQTV